MLMIASPWLLGDKVLKIENIFKKKQSVSASAVLQTVRDNSHPFGALSRYTPLLKPEYAIYDAMREAIPVIDAAISKTIALVGGFEIKCPNQKVEREINEFLENVPVGNSMTGINCFISQHLESLLMYGTSVGEILPSVSGKDIAALYNAPLNILEIEKDPMRHSPKICVRNGANITPVKYPNLIVMSTLNPKAGEVCGRSLLSGLPFVSDVLLKIFNTIGVNFERIGNVRFAVTYKPSSDAGERAYAKERANQIAKEWARAMRDNADGKVSDFVAIGDVSIKAIGADNIIPDCNIPVRQMMEQIVARTGIPPFMLGLSWSTTERMSSQQADMLTSELWNYRRILTPAIKRVCEIYLTLKGYPKNFEIVWDNICLQDEVELARADLIKMQAKKIAFEIENETRKNMEEIA